MNREQFVKTIKETGFEWCGKYYSLLEVDGVYYSAVVLPNGKLVLSQCDRPGVLADYDTIKNNKINFIKRFVISPGDGCFPRDIEAQWTLSIDHEIDWLRDFTILMVSEEERIGRVVGRDSYGEFIHLPGKSYSGIYTGVPPQTSEDQLYTSVKVRKWSPLTNQ
ncbi:hypothetical protein JI735_34190 (plasmid) [Paenibacillus sonchi]|uniref:Uncharacterized protein n=1 Tax=Paenibacillus sonchi TaxID=373687 RepID=A0A974PJL6_9BACL|nr:hypothetical protein [Paenibacillus sonchi]QQZ64492.1 hypothetical protein JI735_34190 [Paenibacillus sonchi]